MPEDESQTPPVIPSFASLRAPGRRSAMDWLDPAPPPAPAVSAEAPPPTPRPPAAPSRPAAPRPPAARRPPAAPRPAEWPDLLWLGLRLARAAAGVPLHVALWSIRQPARGVRRLCGAKSGASAVARDVSAAAPAR
jgi:hypothetical protein